MSRFDASIFPTIEEVRERCGQSPNEVIGQCQVPGARLIANVITERLPADVHVTVLPNSGQDGGQVFLRWPDPSDTFLRYGYQELPLPDELNDLAYAFDCLGKQGDEIVTGQIPPLCDRIIAARKETA